MRLEIPAGTTASGAPALSVLCYVDVAGDSVVVSVGGLPANSSSNSNSTVSAALAPVRPEEYSQTPVFDCETYNVSADVVDPNGRFVYHRNSGRGDGSNSNDDDDITHHHHNNNHTNHNHDITPEASPYMAQTLRHENIPLDDVWARGFPHDPLLNRSTGAFLAQLPANTTTAAGTTTTVTYAVTVLTQEQTPDTHAFEAALEAASAAFVQSQLAVPSLPPPNHTAWWAAKWASHRIDISPRASFSSSSSSASSSSATTPFLVSQMYTLQRFVELSQARVPGTVIKFNGMLYGANRAPNSDFNQWGGLNWWQNLRLPYYNMLAAGDHDALRSLLVAFNRTVPIAAARTRAYFGFDGLWWPEYTSVFYGTTHPASYRSGAGCAPASGGGEPAWHSDDRWNGYNRQGSLDLALLVLDYYAYTSGSPEAASLLAIPRGVVQFYSNLWGNSSSDGGGSSEHNNSNSNHNTFTVGTDPGKMTFFPTQALETWQCPGWPVDPTDCPTNDLPTVAGLRAVVEKLLRLPAASTSAIHNSNSSSNDTSDTAAATAAAALRSQLIRFQAALPELPAADGRYIPCSTCNKTAPPGTPGSHRTSNVENAELYAVHPYRLATVARANETALALAKASFAAREFTSDVGWNQNAMDAALLGDAAAAAAMVVVRAQAGPAKGYRFPAFAPHEQDYQPSSDHYAVFSNALQYMLLQQRDDDNDSVLLLPAWPCDWDVSFIVAAPQSTRITGQLVNGTLQYSVDPPARAAAVTAAACQEGVAAAAAAVV